MSGNHVNAFVKPLRTFSSAFLSDFIESCIHVDHQRRSRSLGLEMRLDRPMGLALIVKVVHILLRLEDGAGYERIALAARVLVCGICGGHLDVSFAVLVFDLVTDIKRYVYEI
jgi:hypothetical protein